jgi:hypothetical protein
VKGGGLEEQQNIALDHGKKSGSIYEIDLLPIPGSYQRL